MGTRCNIVLECGDQVKYIYRHYDGYPSSVLPELKKYAEAVRWYADNYTTFCQELAGSKAKAGAEALQNDPKLLLGLYADVLVKHKAWDEMLQTLLVAPNWENFILGGEDGLADPTFPTVNLTHPIVTGKQK